MAQTTLSKEVDDLLKPAFKRLKRDAMAAIRQTQDEMKGVLKVLYAAPEMSRMEGLAVPRLQLRWEDTPGGTHDRVCHYEMVFPLHQHDCRNDPGTGHAVVQLGRTQQSGGPSDYWAGDLADRTPFRDGCHAQWDAEVFGGLPIYVIAPDGRSALVKPTPTRAQQVASLVRRPSAEGDA